MRKHLYAIANRHIRNVEKSSNSISLLVYYAILPSYVAMSNSLPAKIVILIVDDSEFDRNIYLFFLQAETNHHYEFLEADTVASGLELWRSHRPEIMLIDYALPDGNGLDLLREIGAENLVLQTKAIILTGMGDEKLAVQAMKMGAADYLNKSDLSESSLRNRVGQIFERLILTRQIRRLHQEQLVIAEIALRIHKYSKLNDILDATVDEVRAFFTADRTAIYKFDSDLSGEIIAEAILPPWTPCLKAKIIDTCFGGDLGSAYWDGRISAISDIYTANFSKCHIQLLEQFQVRANLVIPILLTNSDPQSLWGFLIVHQCSAPRQWEESDISLMKQLSVQLAIAIQQAELYHNLQIANTALEREIEERKQAELEIQQANATLEARVAKRTDELYKRQQEFIALVENSPNLIIRIDREMRHLYVNPSARNFTGIARSELIGKTAREMRFPQKNVMLMEAAVKALLITGQDQRFEIEHPFPDGSSDYYQGHLIPEYDPNGKIATMLLIFYDITANKLNQMALQESNRRWQSLLDNVRLIVVGIDDKGMTEYVNPFFLEVSGYELEEVIGKPWASHFLPQTEQKSIVNTLLDDFHNHCQKSIATKTGKEMVIAFNNTILQNESGKQIGTISIGEDITEKVKMDRVKSEFISIVSHELRTPLASIRGSLGLLASGVLADKPDTAKQMLDIATFDTERLARLVNDILNLERLESNQNILVREWSDTSDLCKQAIATIKAITSENQIQIIYNCPSYQIFADGDRLVQTLVNLLSNAIKFSPPHTQVSLEVEESTNELIFHVRDQGRGIPANHLESIFERFSQVDASDSREKGGTGLGLAICRTIIQQHGGKIWVKSELTKGSTFSFSIPNNFC